MFMLAFWACSPTAEDTAADTESEAITEEETQESNDDFVPDEVDTSFCEEDYALCGTIEIPSDFTGSSRNLAIVLYESIPPAGPPAYIIEEIENPNVAAGQPFQVASTPVLASGEYYLWFNLYMEGGGEWVPVNDVDYTGSTADPIVFDGSAVSFEGVTLELASAW